MPYVVEIKRARDDMAKAMEAIREWLDVHRFEPDAFRSMTVLDKIVFKLEFKIEREASACAGAFDGRLIVPGG